MDPQQFAPAPESPADIPGAPNTPELSQEEMNTNLQGLMSKIDNKYQDYSANKFAADNKVQETQGSALRQIFDLLQSFGVDPSNAVQVKGFLDKIQTTQPDLFQQIETVLIQLLGEDITTAGAEPTTPQQDPNMDQSNMNINNNEPLQQNV